MLILLGDLQGALPQIVEDHHVPGLKVRELRQLGREGHRQAVSGPPDAPLQGQCVTWRALGRGGG